VPDQQHHADQVEDPHEHAQRAQELRKQSESVRASTVHTEPSSAFAVEAIKDSELIDIKIAYL
jgi:hypothetical protein